MSDGMTTPTPPAPLLLPPVLPAPPRRWLPRGFSFLTSLVPPAAAAGGKKQRKAPTTAPPPEPRRRSDAGHPRAQAREKVEENNDLLSDYHPIPFPVAPVSPAQARSIRHEWAATSRRREEELFEKEEGNDGDVGSLGSLEAEVRRRTLLGPGHAAAEEARRVQAVESKSLSSSLNIGLTSQDVSLHYKRMGQFLDQARRASSPPSDEENEAEGEKGQGAYTLPSSFQRGSKPSSNSVVREFELEVLNAPAWDANSKLTELSRRSHAARAAAHSVLEGVRQLEQRHRLGDDDDADVGHSRPGQPPPSNRRQGGAVLSQLRASLAFLHDPDSDAGDSDDSGSTGSASTV